MMVTDAVPLLLLLIYIHAHTHSDGEYHIRVIVIGISWSKDADKLLVTYQQIMTKPKESHATCYIAKWDLLTAKVQAFIKW